MTFGAPPAVTFQCAEDAELERAWSSARTSEWRSLALVPASERASVVPLARAFSALGFREGNESIGALDLREVGPQNLRRPLEVMRWYTMRGERVILALKPPVGDGATTALARAADCAILCVELGATGIAEANATVEEVGRDRFIGAVLLRPDVLVPQADLAIRARPHLKAAHACRAVLGHFGRLGRLVFRGE
jgi:hypothetical protein